MIIRRAFYGMVSFLVSIDTYAVQIFKLHIKETVCAKLKAIFLIKA